MSPWAGTVTEAVGEDRAQNLCPGGRGLYMGGAGPREERTTGRQDDRTTVAGPKQRVWPVARRAGSAGAGSAG